jgi:ArsR family transcriptional regulator
MFRALAHAKRRQVLAWLKAPAAHFPPQVDGDLVRDGVCVLRIAEKLGVRQPTATRHLQILADAGLVTATRIGKWTFFKRNETAIGRLKSELIEKV